jgi:hypothetical protein
MSTDTVTDDASAVIKAIAFDYDFIIANLAVHYSFVLG